MSLRSLVNDPDFQSLSPDEQKQAVVAVEPDAASLGDGEYQIFMRSLKDSPSSTPTFMQNVASGLNTPSVPIKKLGGELLDAAGQLTGAGDRGIVKANLPRIYGALKSVAGKAEQLTTPVNVGLGLGMAAASPEIATGAAGAFAVNSLMSLFKTAPQKYQEYKDALANNDVAKQTEIVTDAGLDAGMTAAAGTQFIKSLEFPSMGDIANGIKNPDLGLFNVKGRTDKLLNQIPSKIQAQTDLNPISPTKAGQEIQSSFERGFGKQESTFTQQDQAALEALNKAAQEAQAAREGKFAQGVEGITNKYGDAPLGLQEGGISQQKGFQENLDNVKSTAEKVYSILNELAGKAPANPDGEPLITRDLIANIFKQRNIQSPNIDPAESAKMDLWAKQLRKDYGLDAGQIQQVLDQTDSLASQRFTSDTLDQTTLNAYKMLNNVIKKVQNENLTVRDLSLIGTDVNRYAYKGNLNDPIKKVFQAVGGALKEDIANGSEKAGFGALSNNARALWKNYKTLEQSPTARILSGAPEYIIPKIAKANSPTLVTELMTNVPPSARNDFRRAILDDYKERSGGDLGKLAQLLSSKTAETNRAIFGSDAPLIERYAKLGKLIDQAKAAKINIPELQPYTPTEIRTASIIRGQDAGNVIDGLIGKGIDETRVKAAINGMDQVGREALKNGLFQKIKDDPYTLNKVSDPILYSVYGKDAQLFTAYRQILNSRDSNLKTNVLSDIANIAIPGWPFFWMRRAATGFKRLGLKYQFPAMVEGAVQKFKSNPNEDAMKNIFQ